MITLNETQDLVQQEHERAPLVSRTWPIAIGFAGGALSLAGMCVPVVAELTGEVTHLAAALTTILLMAGGVLIFIGIFRYNRLRDFQYWTPVVRAMRSAAKAIPEVAARQEEVLVTLSRVLRRQDILARMMLEAGKREQTQRRRLRRRLGPGRGHDVDLASPPRDAQYLLDMSEAINIGREMERRNGPPPVDPN